MKEYQKQYILNADETLFGAYWPANKARANILLITGMEEHAFRYHEFAKFLNRHGYHVHAVDYYGQGENVVRGKNVLGEVPPHAFEKFVTHLGTIASWIKEDGLPLFVMGHSMGSFQTQRFLQKFPSLASAAVVIGSNGPSVLFGLGKFVAALTVSKFNRHKESKLLAALSLGGYSKSIKNAKTKADWLSYNETNVQRFIEDPLDGGPSSKGFYLELMRGTSALYKKKHYKSLDRTLPLLFIAGAEDPVGNKGKGVKKLYNFYKKLGFNHLDMKLYDNMRHEILNETNKQEVYDDIIYFLNDQK